LIATEVSAPSRVTQSCFHDVPLSPGIHTARPSSESVKLAAPVLTSVATPWTTGKGLPRVASALGIERHGIEGAAAGEDEMPAGEVARHAGAFQDHLALSGGRPQGLDAGVVVVLGRALVVAGEQQHAAVGKSVRPAMGPLPALVVQLGDVLRSAAFLLHPLERRRGVRGEVDVAVAAPGRATRLPGGVRHMNGRTARHGILKSLASRKNASH
jgi:hypothetical protein